VAVLALALTLSGCVTPGAVRPHPDLLQPSSLRAEAMDVQWPSAAWWSDFGDGELARLVERALADSPTLVGADARSRRAAALAAGVDAGRGPQVSLDVASTRQRFSEHGTVPPPYAGSWQTVNNLQLGGGWELDFFGRNRAALSAAIGAQRASEADAEAARLLLATNVARNWFALARLLELQRTVEATRDQRRQVLELVSQRVRSGLDTRVEQHQAEGLLFEVERDLPAIDEQLALARHALAALTVQAPQALDEVSPRWDRVRQPTAPASVPADLVGRRPDLVAARLRVQSSLSEVDLERTRFYPNISLNAFAGFNSIGLSQWLQGGSAIAGIGPAIHLPIFDAGRLQAGYQARQADVDSAIAGYNGALLDAMREVADQLDSLRYLQRQQTQQVKVQKAAEEAAELAMARYRAGLGSFLTVLSAQTNVLAQRRVSIDLKFRSVDADVALIRALGGGYREVRDPVRRAAGTGGAAGAAPVQEVAALPNGAAGPNAVPMADKSPKTVPIADKSLPAVPTTDILSKAIPKRKSR
jgi:NodT family efflux transporter outer membrane factor (OMF) lipoprotein